MVLFSAFIELHQALPPASQPEDGVRFRSHGEEHVDFFLFVEEIVLLASLYPEARILAGKCELPETASGGGEVKGAVVFFIQVMYFDDRIRRVFFHFVQRVVVIRVEIKPRRACSYPEAVVVAAWLQLVDVELFVPLRIVARRLPSLR